MERVEGDPDRQQDIEAGAVGLESERVEEIDGRVDEEVEVLEEPKDPEVHDQAHEEDPFAAALVLGGVEQPADRVVGKRGYPHQE